MVRRRASNPLKPLNGVSNFIHSRVVTRSGITALVFTFWQQHMLTPTEFTGILCLAGSCFSATEIAESRLSWRQLLTRAEPAIAQLPPPLCGAKEPKKCRLLPIDPWHTCGKGRTLSVEPCVVPHTQCGILCSGSLGEEAFALLALSQGAHFRSTHNLSSNSFNLTTIRPDSPRQRPDKSSCEGSNPLPHGGAFLEIGGNNGFASNTLYLEHW